MPQGKGAKIALYTTLLFPQAIGMGEEEGGYILWELRRYVLPYQNLAFVNR